MEMTPLRFPHSEIFGSKLVRQLPEAYRNLLRPSSVSYVKASLVCAYVTFYDMRHPFGVSHRAGLWQSQSLGLLFPREKPRVSIFVHFIRLSSLTAGLTSYWYQSFDSLRSLMTIAIQELSLSIIYPIAFTRLFFCFLAVCNQVASRNEKRPGFVICHRTYQNFH